MIYIIELKIDSTENEPSLTHDMCCNEYLTDELAIIIDIIAADYFVKSDNKYDNCSIKKTKKVLQLISDKPCICKDYLKNSDMYIRKINL